MDLYVPLVHHCIKDLIDRVPDQEDVVQNVFLDVFRGIANFNADSAFSTWIFRIAKRKAIQHLRHRRRQRRKERRTISIETMKSSKSEEEGQYELCDDKSQERVDVASEVHKWLARLPEKQREAIELSHLQGWKQREIAEKLNLTREAVAQRITRGIDSLKDMASEAQCYANVVGE